MPHKFVTEHLKWSALSIENSVVKQKSMSCISENLIKYIYIFTRDNAVRSWLAFNFAIQLWHKREDALLEGNPDFFY